jgi:hypothetical protein
MASFLDESGGRVCNYLVVPFLYVLILSLCSSRIATAFTGMDLVLSDNALDKRLTGVVSGSANV